MRQARIRAAVTGVGGGAGQAIVRALRSWPGCSYCIGFDMKPDSAGFFLCDAGFVVPPARDAGYVDALLTHCRDEGIDVLIPGSDPELLPLAQNRERIEASGIRLLVTNPDVIRIVRSKAETARFLRTNGVPFVETVPIEEAPELAANVGFPVLVKPNDGSATRDVHVVFDDDELKTYLDRSGLIAQEYLVPAAWKSRRDNLLRANVYRDGIILQQDELSIQFLLGQQGEELGVFASRNSLLNGIPMVIEPEPMPEAIDVARLAVRALAQRGLTGPCNLQGRRTESGTVFFEVNARFTGITAMRTTMGFHEVEAVIRHVLWDESADDLAPILQQPSDLACLRYVTEEIVSSEALHRYRTSGQQHVES